MSGPQVLFVQLPPLAALGSLQPFKQLLPSLTRQRVGWTATGEGTWSPNDLRGPWLDRGSRIELGLTLISSFGHDGQQRCPGALHSSCLAFWPHTANPAVVLVVGWVALECHSETGRYEWIWDKRPWHRHLPLVDTSGMSGVLGDKRPWHLILTGLLTKCQRVVNLR